MEAKSVIIGVVIFAIVTVGLFIMLNIVLRLGETISVIVAIVVGAIAEIIYRRKKNS
ncbi:hypothetical protein [Bacillus sp. FJAT-45350]|uniref:hypothetical protein n=1 Tax=Bacillus sp. FJAT-45350 TaxID=2011014 RepID=UPI0015C75959|nr:hypothetical protein [Bacillus sp. FJAT-45350]